MPAFATPEPITATLTTAGARVRVAASHRSDTVVLVEPINSADKSDVRVAENTEVDFSAGELSIRTTKSGDKTGSVAITVELPIGSRLVLNTAWTDVRADGLLGDCELNTASGQVRLDHIAALRANLSTGGVEIGHVDGSAVIEGGAAGVRIGEVTGLVRYQGSTGKIWIGHAWSDVEFGSARGSVDVDRAEGSVIANAGDCPIRIGRMTRGQAELTNASGGIEVGISEGAVASVDARSTKGVVRSSLPAQDTSGEFDNEVRVYARTRLDDIVIHPAAV
ncbi:DUF4097 family beta strand repeat-containing protein [Streptoalloteichus hindustanus]|uniref:DUF4097 domain-containing protein n=1 Tax=Streptoalloteichus hindustanus TaxID=2017 RepID=A0A1M5I275_STRHI|nr:DUF4097 family beta strand repeat-containing protein [Streptoalloteichus hindustanus]SHG22110.1 hypothetical protein SAMN05444320_10758 [Streptoalloteichus hindustanus]